MNAFEEFEDMEDDLDLTLYADAVELTNEVVAQILLTIKEGLEGNQIFHLALTGGSLGNAISETLVRQWNAELDSFKGLHLWWSDERFVEADSVERNALPLHGTLSNKNIVVHEVLASDVADTPQAALEDYREGLKNIKLDLIILGVGPDGHDRADGG